MAKRKTSKTAIKETERQREAIGLRVAGFTYEQIGEKLEITPQSAYNLVDRVLKKRAKELQEEADHCLSLELERLDRLMTGVWTQAEKGDPVRIDRVLKIIERRSKLLGLDAPQKIAETDPEGRPVKKMTEKEIDERIAELSKKLER